MVDSPIAIVFKIIYTLLEDAIRSSIKLFGLLMELLDSLAYTVATGGPIGALMAIMILAPIIYLMSKIFGGNIRTAAITGFIVLMVLIIVSVAA
ncbi:MAG: hypothetical protein JW727_05360 [Candidatus Aenigmarchaeota archaeon]|nr:hypothetical protein [Candidatus Aenigmarchaeota archaeon]